MIIIEYIKNCIKEYKHKKLLKNHICREVTVYIRVKPKSILTGKWGKGRRVVRYNVYESGYCSICNKEMYNNKIATNLNLGTLHNKFGNEFKVF